MKYRNVKTGMVIDIKSELKGKDWEPVVTEPVKEVPKKKSPKKKGKDA